MQSALSLPIERVQSIGQIEVFDIQTEGKQMTYAEVNCLK